jgi:hypothetical protein
MDRPDKKAIPIREWKGAVWDDTTEMDTLLLWDLEKKQP